MPEMKLELGQFDGLTIQGVSIRDGNLTLFFDKDKQIIVKTGSIITSEGKFDIPSQLKEVHPPDTDIPHQRTILCQVQTDPEGV